MVYKNYNLRVVLGTSERPLKTNYYKTKQQLEVCVPVATQHTYPDLLAASSDTGTLQCVTFSELQA